MSAGTALGRGIGARPTQHGRHRVKAQPLGVGVRAGRVASDGWIMTRRNLLNTVRSPQVLGFTAFQPVLFVLLFAYVFGEAIPVAGGEYRQFLIPGIFAQTVVFNAVSTSVGIAEDVRRGLIDRFRSLPVARSAVLVGRTAGDAARNTLVILLVIVCGLGVGWRMDDGAGSALAAFGLVLLLGYAFSWVGACIGLIAASPEVASSVGFLWMFPVVFVSNAFVPLALLPSWLQPVAEWNPMSATVSASRELFGNPTGLETQAWPMQHPVWAALSFSLLIIAVFTAVGVRSYRRATAR